ncbi:MAG: zinc-ribbon domain-containing protein [Proteobacteria bacterium]|nr:zinc-ribbon domain-containing protein [Pseudomonadota bacterium]
MIIQCDECKAKFKLDDSKLKPEGVKVKCKKCSHVFFVYPEREPVKEDNLFEATSQSEDSKTKESIQEELSHDWNTDIFTQKPTFEKEEEKQEGGFTWESFSQDFGLGKGETEPSPKIEEEIKTEEERIDLEESFKEENKENTLKDQEQKEFSLEGIVSDFPKEEEFKEQDRFEFEASVTKEQKEEDITSSSLEQSLLGEGSEFTFEERKEEVTKQEEGFNFIFEEPKEIGEDISAPKKFEDLISPTQGEEKIEEIESEKEVPLQPEDFLVQTPKKFNLMSILISILIVIVIGGGGTGFMWWQKVKMMESMGSFGITNVKSAIKEAKDPAQIFVVTGKIKNEFNVPKSFLKVKCTVYGKNNAKLAEKTVFAGNVFTDAELKELTFAEIDKGLNNKMGKSMINVDVPPGKLLDFMIVFDNIPPDAISIEVEGA